MEIAARMGYRHVTLDGTLPGVRARELDRSARRDIASLLRRSELTCAGLDLWIPPSHFIDPAEQERAVAAVLGAIELAADLARLSAGAVVSTARAGRATSLSIMLPNQTPAGVTSPISERATTCGVKIANHTFPIGERGSEGMGIGVGIDPAAVLLGGADPAGVVHQMSASGGEAPGNSPALARLSDATTVARTAVGSRGGRLDVLGYAMALVSSGYRDPVVVEVRGLQDAEAAAREAREAWDGAVPGV